jgi:hypothetical protein
MAPRASIFYRPEVGNNLPTSPQELVSKRAQNWPKSPKIAEKVTENHIIKYKIHFWENIEGPTPFLHAHGHMGTHHVAKR